MHVDMSRHEAETLLALALSGRARILRNIADYEQRERDAIASGREVCGFRIMLHELRADLRRCDNACAPLVDALQAQRAGAEG